MHTVKQVKIGFKVWGKISKRGKHPFCHIETRLKFLTMIWEVNSRTFKDTFLKIWFFPGISRIFKEISKIQGSSRKFKNVATMDLPSVSPLLYIVCLVVSRLLFFRHINPPSEGKVGVSCAAETASCIFCTAGPRVQPQRA